MTGDGHKLNQTAFRLPEGLLAWLHEQAAAEERTMTAIVTDALKAYRAASYPDVSGAGVPYDPNDYFEPQILGVDVEPR